MAKAKVETKTVERVLKERKEVVTLELSRAQAETLAVIGWKTSGSQTDSRRKHVDEIYRAIVAAGVQIPDANVLRGLSFGYETGIEA